MKKTTSIYIHWPFCLTKCPYCDFNSHVTQNIEEKTWLASYLKEIQHFFEYLKQHTITSIFFGGGTPSLMPVFLVKEIIDYIRYNFKTSKNIEITLEANPTSTESKKLKAFKEAGINRISLGIQSFNDKDLNFLGRKHSSKEGLEALETTQSIFNNYSFDLIYALPDQTLSSWEKELTQALKYATKHISLYQLTIEKGTAFYSLYKNKNFILPDNNLSSKLYKLTQEITKSNSLEAYEISNHALKDYESLHNLSYWNYNEYLGIGPGAHTRITLNQQKHAINMLYNPKEWLSSVQKKGHGIQKKEALTKLSCLKEYIIMAIRIKKGINNQQVKSIYSKDINDIFQDKFLMLLKKENLINYSSKSIRTTAKGKLVTDEITRNLLKNIIS